MIAWRRATPVAAVAQPARAGDRRGARRRPRCSLFVDGAASKTLALLLFAVATFAIGVAVQELWRGMRARQAMTQRRPGASRSPGWSGATAAATAATSCTSGSPCCSSASPRRRRSTASATSASRPGSRRGRRLHVHLREADREDRAARRRARADHARLARPRDEGRQAGRDCSSRAAATTRSTRRLDSGVAEPLLRGRGDERGRHEGRRRARPVDRRAARHRRAADDASSAPTPCSSSSCGPAGSR